MVRRNQHIVAALHLAVSMNELFLYDLSGVELKGLLLFQCFEQLIDIHQ